MRAVHPEDLAGNALVSHRRDDVAVAVAVAVAEVDRYTARADDPVVSRVAVSVIVLKQITYCGPRPSGGIVDEELSRS